MKKEIEEKIIKPTLPNIYKSFHGSEPEFRFLSNCLPYKLNVKELKDLDTVRLIERHGNLSSYMYKNKYDGKIDLSKIAGLSQLLQNFDGFKVEEILKFLETNEGMIEAQDLNNLLTSLLKNAKKNNKYWKLFPNYMSILNHIISIAGKSQDPEVISLLTEMIQKSLSGTIDNDDITPDQLDELYKNIHDVLKGLVKNNIKLDAKRLLGEVNKINSEEWKKNMVDILKKMDALKIQKK